MKLKELVANIVQLNKIPAGSWSNKELGSLSKILERVYTNVGELD